MAKLPAFFSTPDNRTAVGMIRDILAKHGKDQLAEYMSRLAGIEVGAQKFSPHLRDHVSHSIYVFFFGLHLAANLNLANQITPLSWKLSALMHDVGYPVELFTRSADEYLRDVCKMTDEIDGESRSKPVESYYTPMISSFEVLKSGRNVFELINGRLSEWGISANIGEIHKSEMKKGTVDHGILSSLVVMKVIDALYTKNNPRSLRKEVPVEGLDWSMDYYYGDVLNAVASISIHNLTGNNLGKSLTLDKTPLPYLLVLSDALQLWNRYSPNKQMYSPKSVDIEFEKNQMLCSLNINDDDFARVQRDLEKLDCQSLKVNLLKVVT